MGFFLNESYSLADPDGGGNASSKELVHIMHTKGRMVYDATHDSYTYEYFLKDHPRSFGVGALKVSYESRLLRPKPRWANQS
ncbi:MAG: hypothetical protein AAF135_21175 [Bacteroidota bacterium]